ncbi:hypothetical protein AALP_AA1G055900 [Arabis alpina]|uniref:UBA domain-containing protein n=1 Tax=Arabis alpina TaxID=50452 RepID=A0A087HLC1_ARAAL|nr:hypothetical protein AALP_AA1G055900 [Arabis alpina]
MNWKERGLSFLFARLVLYHHPFSIHDEERVPNIASSSGAAGPEFEAKIATLVELGFFREAVIQALILFEGNEEQAAGYQRPTNCDLNVILK